MKRWQFIALTSVAVALALLIFANLSVSLWNQRLVSRIAQRQNGARQALQAEALLRQVTLRMAQLSEQDPGLVKLLSKNGLKATILVDGKRKEVP
ncbi:MAG: hypothetical protein HUU04_08300 [Verrucomicrobiae bacterium]|nr:hypothetical protein [Verrucomicrobiae bacterium]